MTALETEFDRPVSGFGRDKGIETFSPELISGILVQSSFPGRKGLCSVPLTVEVASSFTVVESEEARRGCRRTRA